MQNNQAVQVSVNFLPYFDTFYPLTSANFVKMT